MPRLLELGKAICCLFLTSADFTNIEAHHERPHVTSAGSGGQQERKLMPPGGTWRVQDVIPRVPLDRTIPHVGGKIKPAHKTQPWREGVSLHLSRFHSVLTSKAAEMKPDLYGCCYLLPWLTDNVIDSLGDTSTGICYYP